MDLSEDNRISYTKTSWRGRLIPRRLEYWGLHTGKAGKKICCSSVCKPSVVQPSGYQASPPACFVFDKKLTKLPTEIQVEKWTKSPLLQSPFFSTKKLREIFLLEKFPIYFFLNIPKDVFKSLLRGRETIKKKYREVLEKFPKNMVFWTSKWPVHPSVRPSIRQYKKLYP